MSAASKCDRCKQFIDRTKEPMFQIAAMVPASWNNTVGVEHGTVYPIDICQKCFAEICKEWDVAQPKGFYKGV